MSNETKILADAATRRTFLTAAGAATLLASGNYAYAAGSDKLRIGLIGCGGRGTGAAEQALNADPGVVLTAMGDVFAGQIENSLRQVKGDPNVGGRVEVKAENRFVGLDNYKQVIDSGVDVVLLTAPPGFRPMHIKAAVEAGKHIFAEKPIGTDAVGTRKALDYVRMAKEKKLAFVSGFCWRYDYPRREFYKRVHAGAIGEIRYIHATYLSGPVKPMPPASSRPAGMSDVEWQIRNWYNFVWLCGDGLVEQACHSVDKILWAMKDVPPLKCVASGGRCLPNNEGNIFDHIDVFYEWADGTRASMAQRQIPCPHNDNSDYIAGSNGFGYIRDNGPQIVTKEKWRYDGPRKNMYQVEHDELFASIRAGKPIYDGDKMVNSTLAGVMGRMAAYTGSEVTWDHVMKSQEDLFPADLNWNTKLSIPPMAVPGKTRLI